MSDLPPIKTRVAGVSFDNRDGTPRQPYVKQAQKGDPLALRREPDNPFDGNAIGVYWTDPQGDAHQIGYVPRGLAELLAPMVDEGAHLTAAVVRRGQARPGPGKPQWYGVRMDIAGDLSALAAHWRSGLEPAVEAALALPDDAPLERLAPALGSSRQAIS
ncbi:MAG: hypothetical protein JWM80_1658 [Cyanobacteria bacterium RYN_339]|nr:hypothetical protein [Cyanobacteria bacterium RYN_339]